MERNQTGKGTSQGQGPNKWQEPEKERNQIGKGTRQGKKPDKERNKTENGTSSKTKQMKLELGTRQEKEQT